MKKTSKKVSTRDFNVNSPKLITQKGVLYRSDCLALLKSLKDNSIDCIFADPPFNLGKSYGSQAVADSKPDTDYIDWVKGWLSECVRVLKPGGSLFVYHIPKWLIPIGAFLNSLDNMEFKHWIAIKMKNGFPIKNRLHPAHYGLLYYTKLGRKNKFHVVRSPSPTCRHCGELLRDYGGYKKKYRKNKNQIPLIRLADVWDDISPNIHKKNRPKSINELPITIPERIILTSTNKGDLVFDPFTGGGSTLSTAEKNNRYWIGCEIGNTRYAQRRILAENNSTKQNVLPNRIRGIFKKM